MVILFALLFSGAKIKTSRAACIWFGSVSISDKQYLKDIHQNIANLTYLPRWRIMDLMNTEPVLFRRLGSKNDTKKYLTERSNRDEEKKDNLLLIVTMET